MVRDGKFRTLLKRNDMKKRMIAAIFFLALAGVTRAGIQFTVHVTSATTFEIWMRPDVTIATGPAGISSLGLTFETPGTVDPSGTPSPSTGKWGVVSNPVLFPSSPAVLSTQFTKNASGNWESNFNWNNGTGAGNQTLTAGMEYLLATFTIPAGLTITDILVKDWGNNKVDNAGAPLWGASIAMGTAPDGIENASTIFYPTSGHTGTIVNGGSSASTSTMALSIVALPLDFLSFDASRAGQTAWLKWVTAHEQNVKGFLVERSFTGMDWSTIGTVAASGGALARTYSFTDQRPGEGINYYRIAEEDLDGKRAYTNVRAVSFASADNLSVSLYPIPAYTSLIVTVHSPVAQQATLRVTDMSGKTVFVREVELPKGDANLPAMDVHKLAAGSYAIELRSATMTWTGKFLKQ
jgi:hypothetical protein